jgi:hypothetical protein
MYTFNKNFLTTTIYDYICENGTMVFSEIIRLQCIEKQSYPPHSEISSDAVTYTLGN